MVGGRAKGRGRKENIEKEWVCAECFILVARIKRELNFLQMVYCVWHVFFFISQNGNFPIHTCHIFFLQYTFLGSFKKK